MGAWRARLVRGAVGRWHVLRLCRVASQPFSAGTDATHRASHSGVSPLLPDRVARHATDLDLWLHRAVRILWWACERALEHQRHDAARADHERCISGAFL